MGDVGFSGAQLAVLGMAFGPLLTAIGILFRAVLASKDQTIRVVTQALDEEQTTTKELAKAVTEATTELRELRSDLWRERRIGQERGDRP